MLSNNKKEMHKYLIPIFLLIAVSLSSCQLDIEPAIPGCIQDKIKEFSKSQYACDSGKTVKKYSFQGITVYVFGPGTCGADMTAEVFDVNCKYLGFLGGIAGNTEINGEEFSNAILISVVWEN